MLARACLHCRLHKVQENQVARAHAKDDTGQATQTTACCGIIGVGTRGRSRMKWLQKEKKMTFSKLFYSKLDRDWKWKGRMDSYYGGNQRPPHTKVRSKSICVRVRVFILCYIVQYGVVTNVKNVWFKNNIYQWKCYVENAI